MLHQGVSLNSHYSKYEKLSDKRDISNTIK